MQNQYGYPSQGYPPYQQQYQQGFGPPSPGYPSQNPSPQPYQQPPPGPAGYPFQNNAPHYYQQGPSPQQPAPNFQHTSQSATISSHNAFGNLCAPGTNTITLKILDCGDNKDLLLAPNAARTQPLYTIKVSSDKLFKSTKWKVKYHENQSKKPTKEICKLAMHTSYVECSFPWLKWECWPFDDTHTWESDVGTKEGHSLEWKNLGDYKDGGFVLRCYDVDEAYTALCSIVMTDYYSGKIEIDALALKSQDGLDEIVAVAMGCLNVHRNLITKPSRGGSIPSSSSSDSD